MTRCPPSKAEANELATVNIVDGDASSRCALSSLLQSSEWRVQIFASGAEFLEQAGLSGAGCLIMDVDLPDIHGLELQQRMIGRSELPIIFLTESSDVWTTVRAMKAGALEFLTKPAQDEQVIDAVRIAIAHSRAAITQQGDLQSLQRRHGELTRREKEVMALVVAGCLNKQVAAELAISEITVKAHRGRMMRKMKAFSLAHLITMAAALKLSTVPSIKTGARRASLPQGFSFSDSVTTQHAVRL